jgi:SAM-dependent methyltransferase
MEEHIYRRLYELEDTHWWFRGRRAVIWALLDRAGLPASPRMLDAGCGTGRNIVEYGRLGTAAGADPSQTAVAFCHERGLDGVIESGIEKLPFDDGSFDLILATDVLEHIERDDRAARELLRVSAPGGRLLVTVPAYQWLWSQHDDTHHHMRRYTAPRLRAVLRAAGWEPIVETYFNSLLLAPIALVRLLTRRRQAADGNTDYELASGSLNAVLQAPMRAEASLIRRGARLPAGVSIGMVCRPAS